MKTSADVVKDLRIGNEELLSNISGTLEKVARAGIEAGIAASKRIAESEGDIYVSLELEKLLTEVK